MVVKKLLLAIMCGSCFWGAKSEIYDEVDQLLKQVDFVFFVLERNTLRMERYGLNEIASDTNYLSKDISEEHCQFKISLSAPDFRAHSIFWDPDSFCRLKIVSGTKRKPEVYYLPLIKVVPEGVNLDDVALVCFDCMVYSPKKDSTTSKKTTVVEVIVPACDGDLSTQLVLDGSVRAACGFFVQHDMFGDSLPLTGKIKREDALAKGILVTNGTAKSVTHESETLAEEVQKEQEKTKVEQELPALEKKSSWFFAKLITIKNFFCTIRRMLANCCSTTHSLF